jgi:hypothetical protein
MLLQGSCPAGTILTPQSEPDGIQPVWSPVVLPRPHRDTELTQVQNSAPAIVRITPRRIQVNDSRVTKP